MRARTPSPSSLTPMRSADLALSGVTRHGGRRTPLGSEEPRWLTPCQSAGSMGARGGRGDSDARTHSVAEEHGGLPQRTTLRSRSQLTSDSPGRPRSGRRAPRRGRRRHPPRRRNDVGTAGDKRYADLTRRRVIEQPVIDMSSSSRPAESGSTGSRAPATPAPTPGLAGGASGAVLGRTGSRVPNRSGAVLRR
jgi:hypothetical protein